jgi:transposase
MNPKESYQVSDELWAKIQPLLPKRVNTHRFGGGRPPADDRQCLNAILFVLRTGCQWNALNATSICPSSTAHDRFQQWVEWAWLSMDGAMTKAPLGGEKMRAKPHRSCQERCQAQLVDGGGRRAHRPDR